MKVTANVEYTLQNEEKWLTLKEGPDTRGMVESEYQYSVTANIGLSPRRDIIRINSVEQSDEPVVIEVAVEQEAANVDDVIPDDIKVKVESVGMIQVQNGNLSYLSIHCRKGQKKLIMLFYIKEKRE